MSKRCRMAPDGAFYCVVPGCPARTTRGAAWGFWCARHWALVPSDLKRILLHTYRPGRVREKNWTIRFRRAVHQTIRHVLQIALSGHRIPKPTDFDFDTL
jgi:hypothetical protein